MATVSVTFNTNIQSSRKSCADIFAPSSLSLLGSSPSCKVLADRLVINLGLGVSLAVGDSLTFTLGNGITELQSEPEYSQETEGGIPLAMPEDTVAYTPSFSLSAPSKICASSSFPLTVGDLQGFGPGLVSMAWSMQPEVRQLQELLPASFSGAQQISVPDLLTPGQDYTLTATATNSLGLQSAARTVKFSLPSALGLSVALSGPSSIQSDKNLEIRAEISQCNTTIAIPKYRYFWSSTGPLGSLARKNLHTLRLPPGTLQGGATYNFSVIVESEQDSVSGSAWLEITVEEAGPLAKLAANTLMYGTQSNIVLDATLSEDRDNSAGELHYEWSCASNSSGCFVYREGEPSARLEEVLEQGQLNNQYVVLDEVTLTCSMYLSQKAYLS